MPNKIVATKKQEYRLVYGEEVRIHSGASLSTYWAWNMDPELLNNFDMYCMGDVFNILVPVISESKAELFLDFREVAKVIEYSLQCDITAESGQYFPLVSDDFILEHRPPMGDEEIDSEEERKAFKEYMREGADSLFLSLNNTLRLLSYIYSSEKNIKAKILAEAIRYKGYYLDPEKKSVMPDSVIDYIVSVEPQQRCMLNTIYGLLDGNKKQKLRNAKEASKSNPKKGFIYLIGWENSEYVKIGLTTNIPLRLAGLQTSCPYTLSVEKYKKVKDCVRAERTIHGKLDSCRSRGEWFHREEAVLMFDEFIRNK